MGMRYTKFFLGFSLSCELGRSGICPRSARWRRGDCGTNFRCPPDFVICACFLSLPCILDRFTYMRLFLLCLGFSLCCCLLFSASEAHMELQRETYCRRGEHETSKKHGKLRTKYNRLAWGVHMLSEISKLFLHVKEHDGFDIAGCWSLSVTAHASCSLHCFSL